MRNNTSHEYPRPNPRQCIHNCHSFSFFSLQKLNQIRWQIENVNLCKQSRLIKARRHGLFKFECTQNGIWISNELNEKSSEALSFINENLIDLLSDIAERCLNDISHFNNNFTVHFSLTRRHAECFHSCLYRNRNNWMSTLVLHRPVQAPTTRHTEND